MQMKLIYVVYPKQKLDPGQELSIPSRRYMTRVKVIKKKHCHSHICKHQNITNRETKHKAQFFKYLKFNFFEVLIQFFLKDFLKFQVPDPGQKICPTRVNFRKLASKWDKILSRVKFYPSHITAFFEI